MFGMNSRISAYDSHLLEILKEHKTVEGFLDIIFGFLARRCDAYCEMKHLHDVNCAAGLNEDLVLKVLRNWKIVSNYQNPSNLNLQPQLVGSEVKIQTEWDSTNSTKCSTDNTKESDELLSEINDSIEKIHKNDENSFQQSDYYNGAVYDSYCWSQTCNEIEIHVNLPQNIKSSKQLSVNLKPKSIHVKIVNGPDILNGDLYGKCKHTELMWNISGKHLLINFDKFKESWWEKLLTTEPSIDVTKIDVSRPIEELSEDTYAAINKLRFDQEQKMLGKPTSDQIRNETLLKKAWDVKGSPFSGQPFNPDAVQFY